MKKLLRGTKRLLDKIFGTVIDELYWRFRHCFNKHWAENYISEESLKNPQRRLLIEKISVHAPLGSVLEIGCASGPNLYAFSREFPDTQFFGIDISRRAVEVGTAWMNDRGIKNVKLFTGKADKLGRFPDKNMDIVLSVATLLYIGPDKIDQVIDEMLRVAKKALVLIEWHTEQEWSYAFDHWAYNWKILLEKHGQTSVSASKLTFGDLGGGWKELGYLIEVQKK